MATNKTGKDIMMTSNDDVPNHFVETKLKAVGAFHPHREIGKDKEPRFLSIALNILERVERRHRRTCRGLCPVVLEQVHILLGSSVLDQEHILPCVLLDQGRMHKIVWVLKV